jgi:hypothetical protein
MRNDMPISDAMKNVIRELSTEDKMEILMEDYDLKRKFALKSISENLGIPSDISDFGKKHIIVTEYLAESQPKFLKLVRKIENLISQATDSQQNKKEPVIITCLKCRQ